MKDHDVVFHKSSQGLEHMEIKNKKTQRKTTIIQRKNNILPLVKLKFEELLMIMIPLVMWE